MDHCQLREADFFWAETKGFAHSSCDLTGVRWPEAALPTYGPRKILPPEAVQKSLYRLGAAA